MVFGILKFDISVMKNENDVTKELVHILVIFAKKESLKDKRKKLCTQALFLSYLIIASLH